MATGHRFVVSSALRRRLEALRYRGVWSDVHGLADKNDAIMERGGFRPRAARAAAAVAADAAAAAAAAVTDASTTALKRGMAGAADADADANVAANPSGAWQPVVPVPTEVVRLPELGGQDAGATATAAAPAAAEGGRSPRFDETQVCVCNVDTVTAAVALGDAAALSFANATTPGGRYRHGGLAQEEDLCRLLPQLYHSISAARCYPIQPGTALVTAGLESIRLPGTYRLRPSAGRCAVLTAAMPCGTAGRRPAGGWLRSSWAADVTLRIRSVLHAAKRSGQPNLVLGAFGCGAFGNPARPVAALFREQLQAPEFRGAFAVVVFAVLDPRGTGNLRPFKEELGSAAKWRRGAAVGGGRPEQTVSLLTAAAVAEDGCDAGENDRAGERQRGGRRRGGGGRGVKDDP